MRKMGIDYNKLETYGGTLQLVFGEDGAVTMVQGGGNAEGT